MNETNSPITFQRSIILIAILGGFYIAGQHIASEPGRRAVSPENTRDITVQGTGEVHVKPDIAKISVGLTTGPQPTAKAAIDLLATKFNAVVDSIKANGVKEEDIKASNLSVNPNYDYNEGKQILRGFTANETVEVKIRNLDKIGDVVAQATAQGANQVGGISLEVDEPEAALAEAQAVAIKDARDKAQKLAKDLGVGLGPVKSFSAANNNVPRPIMYDAMLKNEAAAQAAPEVPTGTNDITATVSITYELR